MAVVPHVLPHVSSVMTVAAVVLALLAVAMSIPADIELGVSDGYTSATTALLPLLAASAEAPLPLRVAANSRIFMGYASNAGHLSNVSDREYTTIGEAWLRLPSLLLAAALLPSGFCVSSRLAHF